MQLDPTTYKFTDKGNFSRISLLIGILGLILSAIGLFVDRSRFFQSWLISFSFWFSIALGGLFMVMLHHLVGAVWSVVLRRIEENFMALLPWMILFFIPLVFGLHDLYHWSQPDAAAHDALIAKKAAYLNPTFFYIRAAGYFIILWLMSRGLYRASIAQDEKLDARQRKTFQIISAPGMLLFAVTTTFASFDWLMSLDPHWYSTIFGVYFYTGSLVAIISIITLVAVKLRMQGFLKNIITVEHYHDLGKLTFAFMILWAYMAFSQYFLIWYGDIPEETSFFHHRWGGGWKVLSLLLIFGHFVIPFFLLISRAAKRMPGFLAAVCFWLLFMHWIDLYWIVMPVFSHHFVLSWLDFTTMIGIGGIFMYIFGMKLTKHAIIPVNDPQLQKSINLVS